MNEPNNSIGGYTPKVINDDFTPNLTILFNSIANKELVDRTLFLVADIREPNVEILKKQIETIYKNCENNLDNLEIMLIALLYETRRKRYLT